MFISLIECLSPIVLSCISHNYDLYIVAHFTHLFWIVLSSVGLASDRNPIVSRSFPTAVPCINGGGYTYNLPLAFCLNQSKPLDCKTNGSKCARGRVAGIQIFFFYIGKKIQLHVMDAI